MRAAERISVVIPTKDGADTVGELLARLFDQEQRFDLDVVVIDSGSRDGTLDVVKRFPVRLEQIAARDYNHGATRNLGIRASRGDLIVLLTQDAIPVDRHLLASLAEPFANPRVAGVYGRQIPRSDCDVVRRRELESWLTGRAEPALAELRDTDLEALPPLERYQRCVFDNVCSAVRRDVWERLPFPVVPFGEDIAWGRSVLRAGHAIAYEPRAAVIHSHRRPVAEEYRRTRLCHRALNDLFDLATVPRRRDVLHGALWGLRHEIPYAWRHAPRGRQRWLQTLRIAGMALANPLGQYHGQRDAKRMRGEWAARGRR